MPEEQWDYTYSIRMIRQMMGNRMYPLTLAGLDQGDAGAGALRPRSAPGASWIGYTHVTAKGAVMPPIFQAVVQVYRDVFHCIGELRPLALIVLAITLAFQTAEVLLLAPEPEKHREICCCVS